MCMCVCVCVCVSGGPAAFQHLGQRFFLFFLFFEQHLRSFNSLDRYLDTGKLPPATGTQSQSVIIVWCRAWRC